jgi:uncharacterized membrane protein YdjX (TVP38/TMEM64 family)
MSVGKRIWLLLPVAAVVAASFMFGLNRQAEWDALAAHQASLHAWVAAQPVLAAALFAAIYAAVVALSLPFGAPLSITGGLLFGTVAGTALVVLGATSGAVLLFLLLRGVFAPALAPLLARRAAPFLDRLRPGLERDGFAYLLALRLIPAVPFWLLNLAPPLVGMRLAPFAAATVLGIVPLTLVLTGIGAGIGGVLAGGGQPDLSVLRSPGVLLPLAGLAALSLLPVAWRRWRGAHG